MYNRKKSRVQRNSTYGSSHWRTYGRRLSRVDIEDDDSDVEESNKPANWMDEFFGRRSETQEDEDVEVHLTQRQTLILSTLVPDEILLMEKFEASEPRRFVGVLMMADVSGYTSLSERYNNTGKGGTYRLTVTLNTYLGALIQIIYSHGGDIIKFAGDAFLALWKTDKRTFLCQTIHSVIACALVIQHSYANYETDVRVNLRVKLAISAGNLMFAPIGGGIDMNYVIFGLPVMEAKLAESVCGSGEVILTPNAWAHCYSRNYDYTVRDDGHVLIKTILYDPSDKDISKPFLGFGALLRQVKQSHLLEEFDNIIWDSSNNITATELLKQNDALSLRKAILVAEKRNIGSHIRNFMIRPVLTQIDAHQPLEYLTEMRQVSIVFVTLKPRDCSPLELITIVNNSYKITCEIVYKSMGCVNKIILFDKDVMMLVIFGLRGFKHESEAQAALKCAYGIRKSVSALDGVLEVSGGVTTGQVYCGVVGHPLRREFTVIGAIVNKAARLMCYYRNKITCDETTYVKSKMSKNGFTLQPYVELKGIYSPGKIYEYTEDMRISELYNIPMIQPLLNRNDEIIYFENWLDQAKLSYRDFDALMLIGESRIGKSSMLQWMARLARNKGLHVCYINLSSIHSATPYLALTQIIDQLLCLEETNAAFAKEQRIVELLGVYDDDLCYLNNVLKVRFAYHEAVFTIDERQRKEKARATFKNIVNSITDTCLIFLDDLHNLDASSWEYISIMLTVTNIFTVMTVTRGKFSSVHKWLYSVFINETIRKIVLGPLTTQWIPSLACQILNVDAVPNDLCNALRTHCKGMPGLVESLIVHLFSNGAINIMRVKDEELVNWKAEELQFPDSSLLKPLAIDPNDQKVLDERRENDSTDEISICVVTNKSELNTNVNEHNIDALMMVQIDSLTPYQQLLLKIASVIGNILSRDLLENIMYENDPVTTAKAIKRLFAMRILSCASAKSKYYQKKNNSNFPKAFSATGIECECSFDYDPDNSENLPKYAFCQVMRFRSKNSRKTCYELLPMNQKKEFHSRIVNYLENETQKCPECGGTVTVLHCAYLHVDDPKSQPSSSEESNANSKADSYTSRQDSEEILHFNAEKAKTSQSVTLPSTNICKLEKKISEPLSMGNSIQSCADLRRSTTTDQHLKYRRDTKRITISSFMYEDPEKLLKEYLLEDTNIFGLFRPIMESTKYSDWHDLGVIDSTDTVEADKNNEFKNYFAIKIEKGVSQVNFKSCSCTDLNIVIYEQLIYHATQAELKLKAIHFSIQYGYLCLLDENTSPAIEKLEEAENLCNNTEFGNDQVIPTIELKRCLGRIYSLKAACYLLNGRFLPAKYNLELAAPIYGLSIKKSSNLLGIKDLFLKIRNKIQAHEKLMKADSVFCLNVGTLLYSALGDEKSSKICSSLALKIAQTVNCRIIDLCDAFTNAFQFELDRGNLETTIELERSLSHVLHHLEQPIKANELYALGKLYLATFHSRTARAELPGAIRSGFRAIVVSNFLHAYNVSVDIIPDLFYILVCRRRFPEAIDLIGLCLRLSKNRISRSCETWYYALCMDLILDAGFQHESPQEINRYFEMTSFRKERGSARRRLVVNLWTYWLRMDIDRKAKKFEEEALSWIIRKDDDGTLMTLLSALRLAEAMLESLARKMDDLRKVVDLMELRSIADRELNGLEKDCRIMRILYGRWTRLKATSLSLSGRRAASTVLFNQAVEESRRVHNHLEEALARACLCDSRFWTLNARTNNFEDWRCRPERAENSWHTLLYKTATTR